MTEENKFKPSRRDFLISALLTIGGVATKVTLPASGKYDLPEMKEQFDAVKKVFKYIPIGFTDQGTIDVLCTTEKLEELLLERVKSMQDDIKRHMANAIWNDYREDYCSVHGVESFLNEPKKEK